MNNMLPTPYQQFIHKSRYARWIEDEGRREDWHETVYRYTNFMANHLKEKHDFDIPEQDLSDIHDAILGLQVMPSMRAMMTSGAALERDNVCGYNCSYIPVAVSSHHLTLPTIYSVLIPGVDGSLQKKITQKIRHTEHHN